MNRNLSFVVLCALALALAASFALAQGSSGAAPTNAPAKATAAAAAEPAKATVKRHAMPKEPLVDLNAATKEELMKLSGIDDAIADKIIAGRPYTSKAQLIAKKILTSEQYGKIRMHVFAKSAKPGRAAEKSAR